MFEERLGFQCFALQIQYPSEGVQISRIVRLGLNRLLAHRISLLQFLALDGQIIGVIVQNRSIVRSYFQCRFIRLERLGLITQKMIHVTDGAPRSHERSAVSRRYPQHLHTILYNGWIILPVELSSIGKLQKTSLLRESHHGRITCADHLVPIIDIKQGLDIAGRRAHIVRKLRHHLFECIGGCLFPVGNEIVQSGCLKNGRVCRMGIYSDIDRRIQLTRK